MKEISIEALKLGMCISKDIYNDLGNIILAQGTEISSRHLEYFEKHHISSVFVDEDFEVDDMDAAYRLLSSEKYRLLNTHYGKVLDRFKKIYYQIQNRDLTDDIETVAEDLKPLVNHLIQDNDVLGSLRLVSFREGYNFTHAVNVSMLGAMLGKWLNLDREMIESIALAGLLHDIGKTQVNQDLLFKSTPLSSYEYEDLNSHSRLGYEILKHSNLSKDVLAAILFHHERSDGSGYPSGLKEAQTPYMARIIAVVDVFDAITSDRFYKTGISTFKAFSVIKDESFKGLDPEISDVFLSNIAAYFINNRVKLSNGKIGEVVYVNKYALNRPLVKLSNDHFLDMSTDYSVDIVEVLN